MIWEGLNQELQSKIGPRLQKRMSDLEAMYRKYGWIVADQRRRDDPASEESYRTKLSAEIETATDKAPAWYNLGHFEARLNNNRAAVGAYSKALEVQPRFFDASFNQGYVLESSGDRMRAEELYMRSIRLNRGYVFGYTNLLGLYYDLLPARMPRPLRKVQAELLEKANQWILELNQITSKTKWPEEEAKALNNAAMLRLWQGDLSAVMELLQAAQYSLRNQEQEISLAGATIQANLGILYAARNELLQAREFYQRAVDIAQWQAKASFLSDLRLIESSQVSEIHPKLLRARPAPPMVDEPELVLNISLHEKRPDTSIASQQAKVRFMQDYARETQAALLWMLDELGVRKKSGSWLVNTITTTLSVTELVGLLLKMNERIAALQDVEQIDLAEERSWALYGTIDQNILSSVSQCSPSQIEAHIAAAAALIGASSPWAAGLTGAGNTIAVLDTGVSPEHLDLRDKIRFGRAAEMQNQEIFGEAVQGGSHNYDLEVQAGTRELTLTLEFGLTTAGRPIQSGVSADLEIKLFPPGWDWAMKPQQAREENPPEGGWKRTLVYPIAEAGKYRVLVRGRKVEVGSSPWRGALFRLTAADTGGYPDRHLTFSSPYDDQGHGTHVAGIIAGTGQASNGHYQGTAPGATIVSAKVLDYTGQRLGNAAPTNLRKTIEWAVDMGANIINMSFGSLRTEGCGGDCEFCRAANMAVNDLGAVVVVAAGNSGPAAETIGCPGNAKDVITVGSCTLDGRISEFSSRGPTKDGRHKPDLVAPGEGIISCFSPRHFVAVGKGAGSEYVFHPYSPLSANSAYIGFSGTSMAAPLVSGAIACLLQADPTLSPAEVKKVLMDTATKLKDENGNEYSEDMQGAGMLNLAEALKRLRRAIVEEIKPERTTYAISADRIQVTVQVRNMRQEDLVPLVAKLSLLDPSGLVVWRETKSYNLLEAAAKKEIPFRWRPPTPLRPGIYQAMVQLTGILSDESGPIEIRRNLEYHTLGPAKCFEVI